MNLFEVKQILTMIFFAVALILVGYQFYFWPQKAPLRTCRVGKETALDRRIPFFPKFVWIYSALYYPFMISPIFLIETYSKFFWVCCSYLLLLLMQVSISHLRPIRTPESWRVYDISTPSTWFLKFIQTIDRGGNCFPSMHVAVAVITALHLTDMLPAGSSVLMLFTWAFVALIAASTVLTKQHFAVDIFWGALLAVVVYFSYSNFVEVDSFVRFFSGLM